MRNKNIHYSNINVVPFDVDNTLVNWDKMHHRPHKGAILFIDPYTKEKVYLKPHKVHIRLLKQFIKRGFLVLVWSKQGGEWAEAVIKTLGLLNMGIITMSKPEKYVDDKPDIESVIGSRVWLEDRN